MSEPEQLEIAETQRKEIPEVEEAAAKLRAAERACSAAQDVKAACSETLLFALVAAGQRAYKYTDSNGSKLTIVASSRTTVKIKQGWE